MLVTAVTGPGAVSETIVQKAIGAWGWYSLRGMGLWSENTNTIK